MEFLKQLKTKAVLKNLVWVILFLALGLAMLLNSEGEASALIMGIILTLIGAAFLIYPLSGAAQKQMLEKAKEMAPQKPEVVIQCAQQLYIDQKPQKGLRIGYGLVLWQGWVTTKLFDVRDICWIYQQTTTTRIYGIIPAGKSYNLLLRTRDRKTLTLPTTKKQALPRLQELKQELPNAVAGYSKEREALYNKDPGQFAKSAAALRAEERTKAAKG